MLAMLQYEMSEVHLMKKRLYMLVLLLLSITLIACQPTDADELQKILDQVEISYVNPDTVDAVTQDIELMNELGDVVITWSSSHPDIISSSGVVNRPSVDTEVTLTATVTLGEATESLTFVVIVKAIEIVIDPLEVALSHMNSALSYTMTMTFETDDESYVVTVKMSDVAASVEALEETIYYEVDEDVCYIYEYIQAVWTKTETNCSEKGTTELAFLNNFSKDFFVKQQDGETAIYVLKTEYYQSLQSFLGSSSTSNFRMTLSNDYIDTIWLTMVNDDITFDVTIQMSSFNATTVTLPVIPS
jgi:hypothetical protein